nr:helix-turn-helix transcriptional regulator [Maliibacterium massiliense]
MDYVDKLTAYRLDHDLTQTDIARLLYRSQKTISCYERRRLSYRVEDIIALCRFYHISADDLFGLRERTPDSPKKR